MTLRTGSLRIDPIAVTLDGEAVVGLEKARNGRQGLQPGIARAAPRVAEDYHGRGAPLLEAARELVTKSLDARVSLVVKEMEVVEEARGLAEVQTQERVNPALGHIHHLHRAARDQERLEISHEARDAPLLGRDPGRIS